MAKSKKGPKVIYFVHLITDRVNPGSVLLEFLIEKLYEDIDNACPPKYLLFGFAYEKWMIEEFFTLHRRDKFVVTKRRIRDLDDAFIDVFGEPGRRGSAMTDFEIIECNVTAGMWYNGIGKTILINTCMTIHEVYEISNAFDAQGDYVSELAGLEDCYNNLIKKVLTDKMIKYLKGIKIKRVFKACEEWDSNIFTYPMNEYGALMHLYKEVLIGGGDSYKNIYI